MKIRLHAVRRSMSAALLLAVTGAGCASDPAGMDPDIDPEDTTAPRVVDTVPAANQAGVPASEKIVVTFSEQMDPATVESAYSSSQLPLDKVSFEWNPGGTVLTIRPDAPLLYSEGTGTDPLAVPPLTYGITIGAGAADLAGNPLGTPMNLSFATKRRLVASFGVDTTLTRVTVTISSLANTEIMIGDASTDATYRSYLTFDLSALPANSVIEEAQFSARQLAAEGAPYNMGPVNVHHITYNDVINGVLSAAQATSLPGVFSADAIVETKTIDVTSQVQDDVANRAQRNHRSQYRLQIDQATDGDGIVDRAIFAKNTFQMTAVYVVD